MKTNFLFYPIVMTFFITSCMSDKQAKDGLAFIDVTKNYPEKEFFLNAIADVSYLYLNSDVDDYLYKGSINYITKNTVVVVDKSSNSILFFSKDGTPKSRFNRRGQGPEEYIRISDVIFDETADEVFVSSRENVIQVYSSTGMYKRKITLPQETLIIDNLIDFDDRSLFFLDINFISIRDLAIMRGDNLPSEDYVIPFYRISKTDGKVLDYVELPGTNLLLGTMYDGRWLRSERRYSVKSPEGVILWNAETDTVFLYRGDKSLTPAIYQTPPAASLNPVEYLSHCIDRGQYQFIQVTVLRVGVVPYFFPAKYYMRNKKTGEIFRYKFLLADYQGKEFIMNPLRPNANGRTSNDGFTYDDGYCFELDLSELKQAYRDNKLSGKLKDLVATLNEDEDNNVFMLVEFKSY